MNHTCKCNVSTEKVTFLLFTDELQELSFWKTYLIMLMKVQKATFCSLPILVCSWRKTFWNPVSIEHSQLILSAKKKTHTMHQKITDIEMQQN